ncbi:hypothetical protein AMK17_06685 [Streptomyces sp. CB00072]|nr:hypothetical protein AMK17_06685 [Streptomyces sp. CB00072]
MRPTGPPWIPDAHTVLETYEEILAALPGLDGEGMDSSRYEPSGMTGMATYEARLLSLSPIEYIPYRKGAS